MAPWMAALTLAIVAGLVCSSSAERHNHTLEDNAADAATEQLSLIQTEVVISTIPASAHTGGGMRNMSTSNFQSADGPASPMGLLNRMWQLVTQAAELEGNMKDGKEEAAKRFHKDFIAAALIMTSVFSWSHQGQSVGADDRREGRSGLLRMLPSGVSLRIFCVLLLWLKHYWLKDEHTSLEIMLVLVGVVFDFVNQHAEYEDDMWRRLSEFVPEQFAQLYPFYTLYVIVYYLTFFSSPSNANDTLFNSNMLLPRTCSIGAWFLSVVFGCYLVLPVLAFPPQHIQASAVTMICAGCVAMVVLPRTLAAPVHSPWAWSEDASLHEGLMYELFFARRSLLLGLAHFFFGLVLARARLITKLDGFFSGAADSDVCKEYQHEMSLQDGQRPAADKREMDLWKEFEDEAKRDMIRSLSIHN